MPRWWRTTAAQDHLGQTYLSQRPPAELGVSRMHSPGLAEGACHLPLQVQGNGAAAVAETATFESHGVDRRPPQSCGCSCMPVSPAALSFCKAGDGSTPSS